MFRLKSLSEFLTLLLLGFTILLPLACAAEPTPGSNKLVITHPINDHEVSLYARHTQYFLELAELALSKHGVEVEFQAVVVPSITGTRNMRNLERGLYSLNWMHTNIQREKQLRPIRIPLFKGLIGWRLAMVNRKHVSLFKNVTSLSQLQKYSAGQGHDWPDSKIFRHNELTLYESIGRKSLVPMLKAGRFDYFPRALPEIWKELEALDDPELAVEQHLVLRYPSAYYFFTATENELLAQQIESGLNIAIDDGSFDRVFFKHYGPVLIQASIDQRQIIELQNPYLPEQTATDDKRLWLDWETAKAFVASQQTAH